MLPLPERAFLSPTITALSDENPTLPFKTHFSCYSFQELILDLYPTSIPMNEFNFSSLLQLKFYEFPYLEQDNYLKEVKSKVLRMFN